MTTTPEAATPATAMPATATPGTAMPTTATPGTAGCESGKTSITQPGAGGTAVPAQRRPLPPVEQIRPGLWSVPVPLPVRRPPYTLVYVFETPVGPYLVDAGWDHDEGYEALVAGLATIGLSIADVRGILLTHGHPDHLGLAHRIRSASGAWIALHPLDAAALHRPQLPRPRELTALLAAAGVPDDVASGLLAGGPLVIARPRPPDLLISDSDRLDVPGWSLHALWTPGHSPGHLCFWESEHRLLLSGDHVLPSTVVTTPLPDQTVPDPFGDYLRSLARLRGLAATQVLPAHERPFTGLEARLLALEACHRGRMTQLVDGLRAGVNTVWELAALVGWHRPFADLSGRAVQIAVQDTVSYLAALVATGVARVERGTPDRWRLVTL
ncbi:Zn-dependent hydrolase, glyoxylase [Frankia sp. AiPs1]|uniref:MBL fold metallo-hydrolase n=1 Tax=Frankia sp. AiPa1 TaxID=573492 RepID=UPI00202B2EDF|nr:MBL fold metallo-hydrolase [Frankia sp. AiPa1]MCL9762710.1 MBL fold metallo-hydrolase [Frankia sp. AiPa1]